MSGSQKRDASEDDVIEEIASLWLVEREEGLAPDRAVEFERWRCADPRHAEAVSRLEEACGLLEKMPLVESVLRPERHERGPRLAAMRAPWFSIRHIAPALAAVLVLGALVWWALPPRNGAPEQHAAVSGSNRVVLTDGSIMELNAGSRVEVRFTREERRIELRDGEAHFTVAPNPSRPFFVQAGAVAVRAVGTAFNVRFAPAAVEVLVTEGRVQINQAPRSSLADPASPRSAALSSETQSVAVGDGSPTLLTAGELATIAIGPVATAPSIEKIAPAQIREALAWQQSRLVFAETPLREVVTQFNRRNRTQLVLGDAGLGARPVGGAFAEDNVEAFVRLLESSGDIVAERRGENEIVLRRTP